MSGIKAVFFDIDNTLYNTGRLAEASRRNAIKAMIEAGLMVGEEEGYRKLLEIVRKKGPNFDHHYDVLVKEYSGEKKHQIIAAGIVAYHTTKLGYLVPYPETIPVLLKLKQTGIKLGIISNGVPTKQWEKLIRLGLQHFFDYVIISEDKMQKPDPRIFRGAVVRAGCRPEETMMVGDDIMNDISGANKAGMNTVLVARGETKKPRRKADEPDYLIKDLRGLLGILNI